MKLTEPSKGFGVDDRILKKAAYIGQLSRIGQLSAADFAYRIEDLSRRNAAPGHRNTRMPGQIGITYFCLPLMREPISDRQDQPTAKVGVLEEAIPVRK